jgi:hypothetical protein
LRQANRANGDSDCSVAVEIPKISLWRLWIKITQKTPYRHFAPNGAEEAKIHTAIGAGLVTKTMRPVVGWKSF